MVLRSADESSAARSRRSWSPAGCPKVSLTALKWSMSRMRQTGRLVAGGVGGLVVVLGEGGCVVQSGEVVLAGALVERGKGWCRRRGYSGCIDPDDALRIEGAAGHLRACPHRG